MKQKKLALFDIDGTLIYHVGKTSWLASYAQTIQEAYGVSIAHGDEERFRLKHDGSLERKIAWDELSVHDIGRDTFLKHFPDYVARRLAWYKERANVEQLYRAIVHASELALRLSVKPERFVVGLLTGNVRSIASWKLSHAGVPDVFRFGLYGDEADDRIALARLVFEKSEKELGWRPMPQDIVVIGDTVHDVRCGKAIGAVTIAVTTGMHGDRTVLEKEHPDLLVDSLMDEWVLGLLGLKE